MPHCFLLVLHRKLQLLGHGRNRAAISMWDLVAAGDPCTEDAAALAWSPAVLLMVSPSAGAHLSAH